MIPYTLERVSALGREEAMPLMLGRYKPIWDEMEPLIMRLTAQPGTQDF